MIFDNSRERNMSYHKCRKSLLHSLTHPTGIVFRIIGAMLLCFVGFGGFFCYDNPAALQDKIRKELHLSTSEYVLLYSVYSWPNVFLGFVGGYLLDRVFGVRMGTNIFMILVLVGQLTFSTGVRYGFYWLMLLGRFIFGIGTEPLNVAQNNYTVLWFKGKVLNIVFGLQSSFSGLGSSVNFMVMEGLYDKVSEKYIGLEGLSITFYIASITCVFSLVSVLILSIMDKKAERLLRVNDPIPSNPVKFSDVRSFSGKFWLLNMIIIFFYPSIYPFFDIGKTFFMKQYHMNETNANFICSIVYSISFVLSPLLGFLIDKVGRYPLWIIAGIILTIISHCCLAFLEWIDPYISMSFMGISFSIMASSLLPSISHVISEHNLGIAYGVCSVSQNSGLAISTFLVGIIVDQYGFMGSELFFIGSASVALLAAFMVFIWDFCEKDILKMK